MTFLLLLSQPSTSTVSASIIGEWSVTNMRHIGDIPEDYVARGTFNTRSTTGVPITLAGTPSIVVYKNGGTTEITTGVTLTVDFDSRTGLHAWAVDTSADAAYTAGSDYQVVLTAGTVDSISVVGVDIGSFSIASRTVGSLATGVDVIKWLGTACATPTVAGVPKVDLTHINGSSALGVATPNVNVVSFDPNAIDAASIASDAVTKIQVGLATSTQVTSLLANTRANIVGPLEIEVPDSGTNTALFKIYLMDSEGAMEIPDSPPTITLVNAAGTDRSSRLATVLNPATGVYSWTYTNTAGDTQETLYGEITVTEGAVPRKYPFQTQLVEFSAYRFSSTDRSTLASISASVGTTLSTLTAVQNGLSVISTDVSDCETGIGTAITNIGSLSTYVAVIRAFLLNKHSAATESPTGTYTWFVRNEADSANAYQVVYVKATGARTVTIL